MTETYKIIRFYRNKKSKVILTGLTLEEARKHCSNESTRDPISESYHSEWFDGYTKEN